MYQLAQQKPAQGRARVTFYVPNIGATLAAKKPLRLAQLFEKALADTIVAIYSYIARIHQLGDHLYLFGYSRGALVVQKLAFIIYRFGLGIQDIDALLEGLNNPETPVAWSPGPFISGGRSISIKCLVAWDTVGTNFRRGASPSEINLIPPNVDHVLHALAFHENRALFRPNLFDPNGRTKMKQVWFPGNHTDMGGGGMQAPGLADLSLLWVISELSKLIKFSHTGIRYPDLNAIIPIDAYNDMPPGDRVQDECETRLAAGLIKPDSLIHESVAYIHNLPASEMRSPRRTSRFLSMNDLRAIQWDIRACLVTLSPLESIKRSDTVIKRMLEAQIRNPVSPSQASFPTLSRHASRGSSISQFLTARHSSSPGSNLSHKRASPPPPPRNKASTTSSSKTASVPSTRRTKRESPPNVSPSGTSFEFNSLSAVLGSSDFGSGPKQSQTPPSYVSNDDHDRSAMSEAKVLIGIIGGSGLYNLSNLTQVATHNPETPWGYPSSPITISELPGGTRLAFLARHGASHNILPSDVPARANIAALKSVGVKVIVAFSAVGSLREEIAPGDFIIPDQIIDRTKGIRPASFFQGTSVVAHAMFGDPFDTQLTDALVPMVEKALAALPTSTTAPKLHTKKCVVCMEGPQFSTRAESHMYRAWGGDIINMSVLPEAKLAREAELSYALIATATDYDSWRVSETPVTVAEVYKTLTENADRSRRITETILEELHELAESGSTLTNAEGGMKYSMVTREWPEPDRRKLAYVLPNYFGSESRN